MRYYDLPSHMQEAARRYYEDGIPPGSFLYAVLSNQLVEAFSAADEVNSARMVAWASWLYNDLPGRGSEFSCWGSPEAVERWIAHGGLNGLLAVRGADEADFAEAIIREARK